MPRKEAPPINMSHGRPQAVAIKMQQPRKKRKEKQGSNESYFYRTKKKKEEKKKAGDKSINSLFVTVTFVRPDVRAISNVAHGLDSYDQAACRDKEDIHG